jgi:hypothetical protein
VVLCYKTSGARVWRGSAAAAAATGILAFGWTFSWLWFGISSWSLVILAWWATVGERCATLVGYCFASGIILSVKVKVLGGGLCAYGWVIILLYCLGKNEHISFILKRMSSSSLFISTSISDGVVRAFSSPLYSAPTYDYVYPFIILF